MARLIDADALKKAIPGTTAAEIMFIWAWMDALHPSPDNVQKLKASLNNVAESVALGNLNIWEIRDAIRDEYGWEIK